MKRSIIFLTSLAIIVAAVTYLVLNNSPRGTYTLPQNDTANSQGTVMQEIPNASVADSAGKYIDYTPDVLGETKGIKILFFHASWCPQCRALENDILQNEIPNGVTIIKVDYDNNQSLRQKYGVTIQTTLVKLDEKNQFVEKYVAYDEPTLRSLKRNLL